MEDSGTRLPPQPICPSAAEAPAKLGSRLSGGAALNRSLVWNIHPLEMQMKGAFMHDLYFRACEATGSPVKKKKTCTKRKKAKRRD